jgi:hypothetical protein
MLQELTALIETGEFDDNGTLALQMAHFEDSCVEASRITASRRTA